MRAQFLAHSCTQEAINEQGVTVLDNVRMIEPVGYLDMLELERNARMILSDSGGIQKEAYFFAVPCVTLREEIEWVETIEAGWKFLAGAGKGRIIEAVEGLAAPAKHPDLCGDGRAATRFVDLPEEAG